MRYKPNPENDTRNVWKHFKKRKMVIIVFALYFFVATPVFLNYELRHSNAWSEKQTIGLTIKGVILETHSILQKDDSPAHMISYGKVRNSGWGAGYNHYLVDFIKDGGTIDKIVLWDSDSYYDGEIDKIYTDMSEDGTVYVFCSFSEVNEGVIFAVEKYVSIREGNYRGRELEVEEGLLTNVTAMRVGSENRIYLRYVDEYYAVIGERGEIIERGMMEDIVISDNHPVINDEIGNNLLLDNSRKLDNHGIIHSYRYWRYRREDLDGNKLFETEKYWNLKKVSFYTDDEGYTHVMYEKKGYYYYDLISTDNEYAIENERIRHYDNEDQIDVVYSQESGNAYFIAHKKYSWASDQSYIQSRTGRPFWNKGMSAYAFFLIIGLTFSLVLNFDIADHVKVMLFFLIHTTYFFFVFPFSGHTDKAFATVFISCYFYFLIIATLITFIVYRIDKGKGNEPKIPPPPSIGQPGKIMKHTLDDRDLDESVKYA